MSPRSFVLNQCTIVLPHGGQPMPCTQPLTAMITTIVTSVARAASNRPNAAMIALDSSSPSGRKYFGLLRSETEPIRNFDTPYAIESPVSAVPSAAFEYSGCSRSRSGNRERQVVADQVVARVADEDAGEDPAAQPAVARIDLVRPAAAR